MSEVWSTNESLTMFCSSIEATHLKDLPTLQRWWEWLRILAIVERRRRHNVTWDACSNCVGGAGRAGWGALLGVEALNLQGARTGDRWVLVWWKIGECIDEGIDPWVVWASGLG